MIFYKAKKLKNQIKSNERQENNLIEFKANNDHVIDVDEKNLQIPTEISTSKIPHALFNIVSRIDSSCKKLQKNKKTEPEELFRDLMIGWSTNIITESDDGKKEENKKKNIRYSRQLNESIE